MERDDLEQARSDLEAVWRAMNNPRTTGRQMQQLYACAAELRAEIARLEAANESIDLSAWPAAR